MDNTAEFVDTTHEDAMGWPKPESQPVEDRPIEDRPIEDRPIEVGPGEVHRFEDHPIGDRPVAESQPEHLLSGEDLNALKSQWSAIQIAFVDEPRKSVEQADALVAELMERVTRQYSKRREILNGDGADHRDISTEDLRIALQGYRSFFNRLVEL